MLDMEQPQNTFPPGRACCFASEHSPPPFQAWLLCTWTNLNQFNQDGAKEKILEHVLFERLSDELVLVLDHLRLDVFWPAALHVVHTGERWNGAND